MDGEFSLVRPDGASRRARRQYAQIQEPVGQTMWSGLFWLLFLGCSKKVTRQWGETHNA